jgi:lysophospholipase L1-like esterase
MSSWMRLLAATLVMAVLTGCSSDARDPDERRGQRQPPPTTTSSPAAEQLVYVAVGASETVGVGADDPATQAWPRLLHDQALPDAEYVNVGVSGATVRDALTNQLSSALAADPDVVTVWLAVNDAIGLVPVGDYETRLGRLVRALRATDATVLVGNVPPLHRLPAYRACLPGAGPGEVPCMLPAVPPPAEVRRTVARFNAAVARVVRREGAVLVDLSGDRDLVGLTSADGFHPSTRGHRELARTFAAELPER